MNWFYRHVMAKELEIMWNKLKGFKTYILGWMSVVYFFSAAATNHMSWIEATNGILASFTAMALRNGMK